MSAPKDKPQRREFDDWTELKGFIDTLKAENEFIWRGQASSAWVLSSSLYRYFESQGTRSEERPVLEKKAIERFKRQYMRSKEGLKLSRSGSVTDIMVLMQHYGCPTRMMDWTRSPYVAIFFALLDMAEDGALYGINLTRYQAFIAPKLPLDNYDHGLLNSLPERIFHRFLNTEDLKYPIPLNPSPQSERDFNQQSVFLMDLILSIPTEDVLRSLSEEVLWKLVFPRTIREQVYLDLIQMNIDGYHLFGGLQGTAIRAKEELFGVQSPWHTIKTIDIDF
jgi:hypothetical protein